MTILTRGIRGAHRRQLRHTVARQLPPPGEASSSESDSDSESELGGEESSDSSDSEEEGEEEEEEEESLLENPELAEDYDDDREEEEGATPTLINTSPIQTISPSGVSRAPFTFQSDTANPPDMALGSSPSDPKKGPHLSENTEHLLIAAGSIGATIAIVLIIYAVYIMRKQKLSLGDLIRKHKWKKEKTPPDDGDWRQEGYQYGINSPKSLPINPPEKILRRPTNASDRPFIARQPSRTSMHSRLSDPPNLPPRQEMRNTTTPFPTPPLPIRTSSLSHAHAQAQATPPPEPTPQIPQTPRTPTTTFAKFLANRRTSVLPQAAPLISRFSLNTSQAAPTPRDPTFPARPPSASTTRSSVPRFRTIDSWVAQQSDRLADDRVRLQFAAEAQEMVPEVPAAYRVRAASESGAPAARGHVRQVTGASDATVFRQHPGTEIVLPRGSVVPSEVLDRKIWPAGL